MSRLTASTLTAAVLLVAAVMLTWRPWRDPTGEPPASSTSQIEPGTAQTATDDPPRSGGARLPGGKGPPARTSQATGPEQSGIGDTPEDLLDPLEEAASEETEFRSIGEPLSVEDEDLTPEAPVSIGEPLDADDPYAAVPQADAAEPIGLGPPLDADNPVEDEAGIETDAPVLIGEPLDADAQPPR